MMNSMRIMFGLILMVWFVSVNAQDNTQSGKNQKWETQIKQNADDLAQNLKARINLDDSETSKISDILAEYNRRVWGIKYHLIPGSPNVSVNTNDTTGNQDQAAAKSQDKTESNSSGDSVNYYAGLGRAEIENLRDADRTTDQDIVNVLGPDQRDKYMNVKLDWWNVVKDRIYSARNDINPQGNPNQNDMDHNMDTTGQNNNWK